MDSADIYALARRISRLERVVAELASREGISIPDLAGDSSGFSQSQGSGFASDSGSSGFAGETTGTGFPSDGPSGFASVDSANDAELQAHLAKGDLIRAIKRYRELTGAGLGEAKDAVEQMAASRRSLG